MATTEVNNRSAFSNVQEDTWGGATNAGDYPDDVWRADTVRHYFDKISGSSNPNLFNQFFTCDFETVRAASPRTALGERRYRASDDFTTDRRTKEESQSAYRAVQPDVRHCDADPCGARRALREDRSHVECAGADRRPASAGLG